MKLTVPLSSIPNEIQFLRQAGYHFHSDPVMGKESFSRRLGPNHYPRFHIYIHKAGNELTFDLHLDQKKVSYAGHRAHSGEYDGPLVERELKRLESLNRKELPSLSGVPKKGSVPEAQPKTWLDKLLG